MKRIFLFSAVFASLIFGANAAEPVQTRAAPNARGNSTVPATTTNAPTANSARAARVSTAAPATTARSATVSPARSAAPTVAARSAATPTVAARAGAMQSVIGTGSKIQTAATNTVVSEACRAKYMGCMDSFCMIDNTSGGRCMCSDRNAELNTVLSEIEKLDAQSYKIATEGVEKIEMGQDANAVIAAANAAAQSLETVEKKPAATRRSLDLTLWEQVDWENEDIFSTMEADPLEGKTGDSLYRAVSEICRAQVPECRADMTMLQMMYSTQIKSDCTAYENNLKTQQRASATKLAAAEKALREAALDQYRAANKYDLGQCTTAFKTCMATTAGCKDDFTGCATMTALDNTSTIRSTSRGTRPYAIKGAVTTIEISASTYDAVFSKKTMCEHVTNSCVAVKDKVWDTFLREVAPQLKSAELAAENDLRMNCIGRISECFQQGCKDTMDPKDPEGSYDLCLTRPETMLNVCKVPLNACGINTSSAETAKTSNIWDFVVAKLASMRVDACTDSVKKLLQSDKACGEDYTGCVGLDLDAINRMVDTDSLLSCQQNGVRKSMDDINDMIQGIMLGIDNSMLSACQTAVDAKMTEICGDTFGCEAAFENDTNYGTEGMAINMDSADELHIVGMLDFSVLEKSMTDRLSTETALKNWSSADYNASGSKYLNVSKANAGNIVSKINLVIGMLASDAKVSQCVNGRDMSQIRRSATRDTVDMTRARYPKILDSYMKTIMNSGLSVAKNNYNVKKEELLKEAVNKVTEIQKAANDISGGGMCYDKRIYGALDATK